MNLKSIQQYLNKEAPLALSEEEKNNIKKCKDYLNERIKNSDEPIYGVNTGFGALCNTKVSHEDLNQLQENLVVSHACGTGDEVKPEIVKLMLLLKIKSLAHGNSGIQLKTVETLIHFFNNDILPVVYEQGSLGASGDLAPLAHLSLPLIGKGEVRYKGEKIDSQSVLDKERLEPLKLQAKEGLALLNGTQFMSAYGIHCLLKLNKLFKISEITAALSIEAFNAKTEPFDALIHNVRKQNGQKTVSENILKYLQGSDIHNRERGHVQDPYSFRCIPQVHGAIYDNIEYIQKVFENEAISVTDNPTIFPEENKVISAGNFHGQPLAMALDQLGVSIAELGNISERRTYKLLSGERGLPAFLIANPGLNSGFMIPQYTAASIVSQNKQLATPASIDSIDSSNGQEDHVSMGANAATKTLKMTQNLEKILSIELMTAIQALDFRENINISENLKDVYKEYRKEVPFVEKDRPLYELVGKTVGFIERWG
ncbi:MAG: histidine ammonia-lyase [Flavobacteriales bacterium]